MFTSSLTVAAGVSTAALVAALSLSPASAGSDPVDQAPRPGCASPAFLPHTADAIDGWMAQC